jgi:HNH endonuclease
VDYELEDRGFTSPCWIWRRGINNGGYGATYEDGHKQEAHRVYYERSRGPIPAGLDIDHLCRVRACVNPEHLEAVTHAENIRRGERAKLSIADLRRIRGDYVTGEIAQAQIAREYGVDASVISMALRGVRKSRSDASRIGWKKRHLSAG